MHNLKYKNAIITGASRGLGLEIAKNLWLNGANVILVARDENALKLIISGFEKNPNQNAHFLSADLSQLGNVDEIIDFASSRFDHLDILVNNAAIQGPIGVSWENDWKMWQDTITVDMLAPINLNRKCSSWMIPQKKGKIISISGGGATNVRPNFSAYAVAKTGLVRYCEILANELMPYNIQVNCISPGVMATSMLDQIINSGPETAGQKEFLTAISNSKEKNQTIERAANLVNFLASTASDGITGKLISAVWDPWESLEEHITDLQNSDIYTIRRIVPKDRGMDWGDK